MMSKTVVQPSSNGTRAIRVLMADPDESLHPAYRGPLSREGFELATASSGLECVARLRETVPDVLVLEPRLPWGGGDGILAMMGEDPDLAVIPVIVLTSCRDAYALRDVARFPVNDYHVKPLAPDRLAGRLRGVLDHPRLRFTLDDHNGRLECAIARRTDGRVRDLRVEIGDGRIVVRGRSDSHHVKQLVLAAVLEAFEASESLLGNIELDMEVASEEDRRSRRTALSEARNMDYSDKLDFTREFDLTRENKYERAS